MTYRFSRRQLITAGTKERMAHYLAVMRDEWLSLQ